MPRPPTGKCCCLLIGPVACLACFLLAYLALQPTTAAPVMAALAKPSLGQWFRFVATASSHARKKTPNSLWAPGGKLSNTCPAGALPTCPSWDTDVHDFMHGMGPSCPANGPTLRLGPILAGTAVGSTLTAAVNKHPKLVRIAGLTLWHLLQGS